jgi:hypothetical protein
MEQGLVGSVYIVKAAAGLPFGKLRAGRYSRSERWQCNFSLGNMIWALAVFLSAG